MSFSNVRSIKSVRKARPCRCGQMIEAGQPAVEWVGVTEGEFAAIAYHPECRQAERALNKLHDVQWWDDWSGIEDVESEDWEWLLTEHPLVAARLNITPERVAEHKARRARYFA